jgi:hypothetical protein
VVDVHRAVFSADEDTATLTLVDVGILTRAALEQLRPELAGELDSDARLVVLGRDISGAAADLARVAGDVRRLAWILVVLTLAVVAGAVGVSPDRRRTVWQLGGRRDGDRGGRGARARAGAGGVAGADQRTAPSRSRVGSARWGV